jgi:hypothetical protein
MAGHFVHRGQYIGFAARRESSRGAVNMLLRRGGGERPDAHLRRARASSPGGGPTAAGNKSEIARAAVAATQQFVIPPNIPRLSGYVQCRRKPLGGRRLQTSSKLAIFLFCDTCRMGDVDQYAWRAPRC